MNFFKLFRTPTALELAVQDIAFAQRNLLTAHKEHEWATARIRAYEERIARLRQFVAKENEEKQ